MRWLDWLLIAIALVAVGAILLNGPICPFNSAPVGQVAPSPDCSLTRLTYPPALVVSVAIAVAAVAAMAVRFFRRRGSH
jgi:membrane protein implicated in regulation of membrane protease activity